MTAPTPELAEVQLPVGREIFGKAYYTAAQMLAFREEGIRAAQSNWRIDAAQSTDAGSGEVGNG